MSEPSTCTGTGATDDSPAVNVKKEEEASAMKVDNENKKDNENVKKEDDTQVKAEEAKPEATTATTTAAITTTVAWDHSDRKVMVKNCMKYLNKKALQKLVTGWTSALKDQVKVVKFKKPPQDNWVVVTLETPEQVPIFVDYINSNGITNKKGELLKAIKMVDESMKDNNHRKRQAEDDPSQLSKRQKGMEQRANIQQPNRDKPRIITNEEIKDAMIPLWRTSKSYPHQLQTKEREMVNKCAIKIVKEIKEKFRQLNKEAKRNKNRPKVEPYEWLIPSRAIIIEDILPAKSIVRNKCEFTFGYRYVAVDKNDSSIKLESGNAGENAGVEVEESNNDTPMEGDTTAVKKEESDTPVEGDAATAVKKEDNGNNNTETKQEDTTMETTNEHQQDDKTAATATSSSPVVKSEAEPTPAADNGPTLQKIPTVGAMARGWSGSVSPPHCCPNIPSEATAVVDILEQFLKDCPMPPYDSKTHSGFWRTVTVRSSRRTNECMLVFVHAPLTGGAGSKDSDTVDNYSPELFESEKARLLSMLVDKDLPVTKVTLEGVEAEFHKNNSNENDDNHETAAPAADDIGTEKATTSSLRVTSVFFQEFGGISMPTPDHPVQHVYGAKTLTEQLGNCKFQISPGAFFQVNTETAEILYNVVVEKVREVATTKPQDTLCFDVCCGTGTIGLTLMKEGVVGKVVGVDISAPAIDDAKVNAGLNGFASSKEEDDKDSNKNHDNKDNKTRFVAARAEHVMLEELKRARNEGNFEKVVAVVDPAREGLHTEVLRSIRGFSQIDRLVYVSCNPTGSLIKDAALLCSPASKRYRGRPFKPTFAQPVDMFPYSSHCELVMVFDRLTDEEMGEEEMRAEG